MKLLGGAWSRGDLLTLLGVFVAVVAILVAHWDVTRIESKKQDANDPKPSASIEPGVGTTNSNRIEKPSLPPHTGVEVKPDGSHIADVSSGEIGIACSSYADATTAKVFVGPTARDIIATPEWVNTANSKNPTQTVWYDKNFTGEKIEAVYAKGSIWGLFTSTDCRPDGHATLTLHVTWTEDPPLKKKH